MNILLIRLLPAYMRHVKHPIHIYPPLMLKQLEAAFKDLYGCEPYVLDAWVQPARMKEIKSLVHALDIKSIIVLCDVFSEEYVEKYVVPAKACHEIVLIGVGEIAHLKKPSVFDFLFSSLHIEEMIRQFPQLLCAQKIDTGVSLKARSEAWSIQEHKAVWQEKELDQYPCMYPLKITKKIRCGYMFASQGCPYECIFCSSVVRKTHSRSIKFLPIAQIADQMESLHALGANLICFEDENIAVSREHISLLCDEIIKRKIEIHWMAHARIDTVDKELLTHMKASGCTFLLFGVESGSERILTILKKTAAPEKWASQAEVVFKTARRIDIQTCALFIIGSPTETEEDVAMSIHLAKKLKSDMVKVHFFTPYPGSLAYAIYLNEAQKKIAAHMYHYCSPLINLSNMSLETLKAKQKEFYGSILGNPLFIVRHCINHVGFYAYNWRIGMRLAHAGLRFLFSS